MGCAIGRRAVGQHGDSADEVIVVDIVLGHGVGPVAARSVQRIVREVILRPALPHVQAVCARIAGITLCTFGDAQSEREVSALLGHLRRWIPGDGGRGDGHAADHALGLLRQRVVCHADDGGFLPVGGIRRGVTLGALGGLVELGVVRDISARRIVRGGVVLRRDVVECIADLGDGGIGPLHSLSGGGVRVGRCRLGGLGGIVRGSRRGDGLSLGGVDLAHGGVEVVQTGHSLAAVDDVALGRAVDDAHRAVDRRCDIVLRQEDRQLELAGNVVAVRVKDSHSLAVIVHKRIALAPVGGSRAQIDGVAVRPLKPCRDRACELHNRAGALAGDLEPVRAVLIREEVPPQRLFIHVLKLVQIGLSSDRYLHTVTSEKGQIAKLAGIAARQSSSCLSWSW